jgi:hypothetical protein
MPVYLSRFKFLPRNELGGYDETPDDMATDIAAMGAKWFFEYYRRVLWHDG